MAERDLLMKNRRPAQRPAQTLVVRSLERDYVDDEKRALQWEEAAVNRNGYDWLSPVGLLPGPSSQ